jgi:hypothetical protein
MPDWYFGWPQIAWIVCVGVSLGINMAEHGKPHTGKHNVVYPMLAMSLSVVFLYYGGFFTTERP